MDLRTICHFDHKKETTESLLNTDQKSNAHTDCRRVAQTVSITNIQIDESNIQIHRNTHRLSEYKTDSIGSLFKLIEFLSD